MADLETLREEVRQLEIADLEKQKSELLRRVKAPASGPQMSRKDFNALTPVVY